MIEVEGRGQEIHRGPLEYVSVVDPEYGDRLGFRITQVGSSINWGEEIIKSRTLNGNSYHGIFVRSSHYSTTRITSYTPRGGIYSISYNGMFYESRYQELDVKNMTNEELLGHKIIIDENDIAAVYMPNFVSPAYQKIAYGFKKDYSLLFKQSMGDNLSRQASGDDDNDSY